MGWLSLGYEQRLKITVTYSISTSISNFPLRIYLDGLNTRIYETIIHDNSRQDRDISLTLGDGETVVNGIITRYGYYQYYDSYLDNNKITIHANIPYIDKDQTSFDLYLYFTTNFDTTQYTYPGALSQNPVPVYKNFLSAILFDNVSGIGGEGITGFGYIFAYDEFSESWDFENLDISLTDEGDSWPDPWDEPPAYAYFEGIQSNDLCIKLDNTVDRQYLVQYATDASYWTSQGGFFSQLSGSYWHLIVVMKQFDDSNEQYLYCLQDETTGNGNYLVISVDEGIIRLRYREDGVSGDTLVLYSDSCLTQDSWHYIHFCLGDTHTLYVDGAQVNLYYTVGNSSTVCKPSDIVNVVGIDAYIGANRNGSYGFNGYIDSILLSNQNITLSSWLYLFQNMLDDNLITFDSVERRCDIVQDMTLDSVLSGYNLTERMQWNIVATDEPDAFNTTAKMHCNFVLNQLYTVEDLTGSVYDLINSEFSLSSYNMSDNLIESPVFSNPAATQWESNPRILHVVTVQSSDKLDREWDLDILESYQANHIGVFLEDQLNSIVDADDFFKRGAAYRIVCYVFKGFLKKSTQEIQQDINSTYFMVPIKNITLRYSQKKVKYINPVTRKPDINPHNGTPLVWATYYTVDLTLTSPQVNSAFIENIKGFKQIRVDIEMGTFINQVFQKEGSEVLFVNKEDEAKYVETEWHIGPDSSSLTIRARSVVNVHNTEGYGSVIDIDMSETYYNSRGERRFGVVNPYIRPGKTLHVVKTDERVRTSKMTITYGENSPLLLTIFEDEMES